MSGTWIDQLPNNLELLALLDPSTTSITNAGSVAPVAIAIVRPTAGVDALADNDYATYKRQQVATRRARSEGAPRTSTAGGRRSGGVDRSDVLASLANVSTLAHYFVYAFTGMLTQVTYVDYQRQVFGEGLKRDSFTEVTLKDFGPVFAAVWSDLLNPCTLKGSPRTDIGTVSSLARQMKCSKDKAKRLMECYRDIANIVMLSSNEVGQALYNGLRRDAA